MIDSVFDGMWVMIVVLFNSGKVCVVFAGDGVWLCVELGVIIVEVVFKMNLVVDKWCVHAGSAFVVLGTMMLF